MIGLENTGKDNLEVVTKGKDGRTHIQVTVEYKNPYSSLGRNLRKVLGKEGVLFEKVKQRRIKTNKQIVERKAAGLRQAKDVKVLKELKHSSAIQMRIPQNMLSTLRTDPDVKSVTKDGIVQALGCLADNGDDPNRLGWQHGSWDLLQCDLYTTTEWPSWAWSFLGNSEKAEKVGGGEGTNVMILDTGVAYAHPDLVGQVDISTRRDFTGESHYCDGHGHGTHCAGIVAAKPYNSKGTRGIAPNTKIHYCQILTWRGQGYWSWIEQAVDYCIDLAGTIDVVSMSIGGRYDGTVLPSLFQQLRNAGVLCVAAAGNSGSAGCLYPGTDENTVCITSTGPYPKDNGPCDHRSSFSSIGPEVHFSAPGGLIWSPVGRQYAPVYRKSPIQAEGCGYSCWSGTSMACPYAAGIFALIKSTNTNATPDELIQIARQTCLNNTQDYINRNPAPDWDQPDWDPWYGWGFIRVPLRTGFGDLKSDIRAGKPYAFSARSGLAPTWKLATDIRAGGMQTWNFQTDYPDNWKLQNEIKVRKDASFSFTTQYNNNWFLHSDIEAQKPYEFSFTVKSDAEDRKDYLPGIELLLPNQDITIRTLFLDYVTVAGSPYIHSFQLWWDRKYGLTTGIEGVKLSVEKIAENNPGGKEIVEEGWIEAREVGGNWAILNENSHLSLDSIPCDSYKTIELRITVPSGHDTSGIAFLKLKITGQYHWAYHGAGIVYTDKTLYSGVKEVYTDSFICRVYVHK